MIDDRAENSHDREVTRQRVHREGETEFWNVEAVWGQVTPEKVI